MSVDYTMYDVLTGVIVRSGTYPDQDRLLANLKEGFGVFLGEALDGRNWKIIEGQKVPHTIDRPIEVLRAEAIERIDSAAERCRSQYITLGSGQSMVYQEKRLEAERIVAGDMSGIFHLQLEADLDGMTIEQKAQEVLAVAQAWSQVSAQIELLRLGAKKAVAVATTPEEISSATSIAWPQA